MFLAVDLGVCHLPYVRLASSSHFELLVSVSVIEGVNREVVDVCDVASSSCIRLGSSPVNFESK